MNKKIKNWDFIIGFVAVLAVFTFIFVDGLNTIQYRMLWYDDAYNSTVAANFARHGEYRVSFPGDITFYNPITTGVTAILPTALLFKMFGISSFTASLVPLLYGMVNIWLFWYLLVICLSAKTKHQYTLSAIGTILLILSCYVYQMICENLWGETASCTFQLLAAIFWRKHLSNARTSYMAWAGAMVALAFLTKSAMIFFVVVWGAVILIEAFFSHNITRKDARNWFAGFACGFAVVDGFKFYEVGDFMQYLRWWKAEWLNMLTQSAGHGPKPSIPEKIDSLSKLFYNNCYFSLLLIIIAAVLYFYIVYRQYKTRKKPDSDLHSMSIFGMCGASLLVYYILFGSAGLMHRTRLSIFILFIKLLIVFLLCCLVIYIIQQIRQGKLNNRQKWVVAAQSVVAVVSCLLLFPFEYLSRNLELYTQKATDYPYEQKQMTEFLSEVEKLPSDATLYVADWWQVPHVSLYLDRKMTNIYAKQPVDYTNGYLLIGISIEWFTMDIVQEQLNARLVRYDTSECDYSKLPPHNRQDFELYAIYKVEPREIPVSDVETTLDIEQN